MNKKTAVKKPPAPKAPEVVQKVETVEVSKEDAKAPKDAPKRIIRGRKYDGRDLDLSKLTDKLVIGDVSPKPPRGAGRPSVMYRIYSLVSAQPGVQMGELIKQIQDKSEDFVTHPTPYTHKERLESLWVRDYLKGMMVKRFLRAQ